MNEIQIGLDGDQKDFQPGETLQGTATWGLQMLPQTVEVRLFWYTEGKGTVDVVVVGCVRFKNALAQASEQFKFQLPLSPYSFSGQLVSLFWGVEIIALPSGASERVHFQMSPKGKKIVL